jgi:hypothetical protein
LDTKDESRQIDQTGSGELLSKRQISDNTGICTPTTEENIEAKTNEP